MKVPKGIVEDVLIKISNFVYPVDFVILDNELVINLNGHIPVILGRPFLAATNAIINYQNGLMKLSFRNLTIDLNIFNPEQQIEQWDNRDSTKKDVHESIDLTLKDIECSIEMNQDLEKIEPPIKSPIIMESLFKPYNEKNPSLMSITPPEPFKFEYLGPSVTISMIKLDLDPIQELKNLLREIQNRCERENYSF